MILGPITRTALVAAHPPWPPWPQPSAVAPDDVGHMAPRSVVGVARLPDEPRLRLTRLPASRRYGIAPPLSRRILPDVKPIDVAAAPANLPILKGRRPRPWSLPSGGKGAFTAEGYYLGPGSVPLEVAVATAPAKPAESDVRNLWKRRKGNQPSPLLLVVLWPASNLQRATVCGVVGDDPAVYSDRDPDQISRLADLALAEPDHHTAVRFLAAYLPEEAGALRNVALFASHHLMGRVRERSDWADLCQQGTKLVGLRREQLVQALGFTIEPKGQAAVLRTAGQARALAVFLDETDSPDLAAPRFNGMTPVSWAIASAAADNIPYVVVTRGPQIRIYTTRVGAGSAGKGGTSAFVEISLPMLTTDDAGYLPLLCTATSLAEGGLFETLLSESQDFAADLGTRLRARVYDSAVPRIAQAFITRHAEAGGGTDDRALAGLYERSLLVLFRLLFVAYAEDRDLLPLRANGLYRQRSLKHTARELADLANVHGWEAVPFDDNATDLWDNVRALWSAVDNGRKEWNVPRYNGGMFSSEVSVSHQGAALAGIELTIAEFGPALLGLLVDESDGAWGPVDFASLDVREFGTIYEGLLESDLALAPCDLTLGTDDTWVPASPRDEVRVAKGEVYLHNKSGARKASGSYFTKPFAVNHLLDQALEPALADHILRLKQLVSTGDDPAATEAFFDFRCVDLSMGSGHFLVAAVDRIERRLSEFLAEHRVSGVLNELARLAAAADDNLKDAGLVTDGIDTNTLLRRQIARRCIYGVDLNPTSVELAKLALWIHTFVKGLPLTSLNHGLIVGNSLTGIGTLDEALDVLDPPDAASGQLSLVRDAVEAALENAGSALARFAATSEATAAEVREARKAHQDAEAAVQPARMLFDLAVAARIGEATVPVAFDVDTLFAAARSGDAAKIAADLAATHFPVAFPEVFLRERPGFDCIIGNPPWEKLHVEEHAFWALRFPGLRSMPVAKMNAEIKRLQIERADLVAEYEAEVATSDALRRVLELGPYPDIGASHPDLYKAFAWRFWQLVRQQGCIGVVLPRAAMAAAGMTSWRLAILDSGEFLEIGLLVNNKGWVFDDVHPQWTTALVSIRKTGMPGDKVAMHGPYHSFEAYQRGMREPAVIIPTAGLREWTTGASLPLIPNLASAGVFMQLRAHPRFDRGSTWRLRPVQGDLNATTGKAHMLMEPQSTAGLWPVYKGGSFNTWQPDTGEVYAWANPAAVTNVLQAKRRSSVRKSNSVFFALGPTWAADKSTLPCLHPRIAFRDVARATDNHTVICALIPPDVVVNHTAPYLLRLEGDEQDEAFVLGVMSSIPFDWYARRVVEQHLTFDLLNAFPVPRPDRSSALWQEVVTIAGRLAAVDHRYAGWANVVGVPVASVSATDKPLLLARLDAAVALLYGLDREQTAILYKTFHEGWDPHERLAAVLAAMDDLVRAKS